MQRLSGILFLCVLAGTMSVLPMLCGSVRAAPPDDPKQKDAAAPDAGKKDTEPPKPAENGLSKWVEEYPIGAALIGLLLLGVAGYLLYNAAHPPAAAGALPFILRLGPSFFFWLGMIYLAGLMLIAVFFSGQFATTLIGGLLPLGVPWFGALGAVTISLEGVFLWNNQWDKKYNYWHIGRPLFGAVLGIVAFFLFFMIVKSSGTQPLYLKSKDPADVIVFFVVAFLVGYREETFRELIKRVTDLLLKPATPAEVPTIVFKALGAVQSTAIDFDHAPAGAPPRRIKIQIQNTSKIPLTAAAVTVTAGQTAFTIEPATNEFAAGDDLAAGGTKAIEVTLNAPVVGTVYTGTLTVSGKNMPTPQTIALRGTGRA